MYYVDMNTNLRAMTQDELEAEIVRRENASDRASALGHHNVILGATPAQRWLEEAQRENLRRALEALKR